MALVEGCKHSLEISIPVEEVETETDRVVASIQQRAKMPGFRPGKIPHGLVRKNFQGDIRQKVLENLIPRHLQKRLEEDDLHAIGQPDVTDVKLEAGEPLRFTAEFEVNPEIDLKDYKDLTVAYHDPEITDEDVDKRLEGLRDRKADFSNVDPRPVEDGDFAVVSLVSIAGVEGEPIKQDEIMLHIGGEDTMEAFTTNLRGMSPGETKQFDVPYPEESAQKRLAGRTVKFEALLKAIRKKELPELNDEFARDLGDYQSLEELKEAIRKSIFSERQQAGQQEAKNKLVDSLVDLHDFPVPEAYVNRQIQNRVERSLQAMAADGADISKLKLDWSKVKESQKDLAVREVKASLLLGKVADRESIDATRDEVDREVERIARQQREPVAAAKMRMEKDGTLGRIASNIQTEKTLSFLFEHARKVAE
ncbi:MAG: trigger factor [Bryobacteraceae bacterium]